MSSTEPSVNDRISAPSTESKDSAAPLLKDSSALSTQTATTEAIGDETAAKPRKRDFWKLGKKPEEDKGKGKAVTSSVSHPAALNPTSGLNPASPMRSPDLIASSASPHRTSLGHPYGVPGSPGYGGTSSPRPHSPASSMIFERNVQEDVALPEQSAHLPSHVIMENHIAPALDASAEAITDKKLNPDTVEIVTHATHQPASVTITGVGAEQSLASSMQDDFPQSLASLAHRETEPGSNYGTLDPTDVRRLSFISFADVVHGEQDFGDSRRDSIHHMSLVPPRSPSPLRSPVSSGAPGTSPPTSVTASVKGHETSPNRGPRGAGSPLPGQSSPLAGASEINVETMRQALRKTGSGDLSHFRSPPLSAVGNDDGTYDRPFK